MDTLFVTLTRKGFSAHVYCGRLTLLRTLMVLSKVSMKTYPNDTKYDGSCIMSSHKVRSRSNLCHIKPRQARHEHATVTNHKGWGDNTERLADLVRVSKVATRPIAEIVIPFLLRIVAVAAWIVTHCSHERGLMSTANNALHTKLMGRVHSATDICCWRI